MKKRKTDKSFIVTTKQVRFSNGEAKISIKDTIRDKDVYILSDVGNNGITYNIGSNINHMSPDDHIQILKEQ